MLPTRAHREILEALGEWTPGHWLARIVGRQFHPNVCDDLAVLFKNGYVRRDEPNTRTSKHSSWIRSEKGDNFVDDHPIRSTASFEHRILDNMDTLSLQFGVDAARSFRLKDWRDIMLSGIVENPEVLRLIREGKNPHKMFLNGRDHLYDGYGPQLLEHEKAHLYLFKEIDRDTEQGRATELSDKEKPAKRRQTWTHKIRAMKEFAKKRVWSTRYGMDCHFQRIITINEASKELIKEIIKEEIGSCKFIGVAPWRDWANHKPPEKGGQVKFPPIYDEHKKPVWPWEWSFTTPYERVGNEPFYLNKFWLMDR